MCLPTTGFSKSVTTEASLSSIAGKVMAKIQYVCLNVHLDQAGILPESQCGSKNLYCSFNFHVAAILVM